MPSSPLVLRAAGLSDTGPVRRVNEDAFILEPDLGLFAVADGMGGRNAGEVASRLALESLVSFVRHSHEESDFSWPYGIDAKLTYHANRLRTAISLANRRVFRAAESHDDYTGMGSTLAALLFGTDSVVVGHIGDSRAYLNRGGVLTQLTQDDTWAMAMLAEELGGDTAKLASHPMRHVLTNVLGTKENTEIHVAEHQVQPGDRLIICSDGLHGVLDGRDLQRVLASADGEVDLTARQLVDAALERRTRDNVTVVVVCLATGTEP
jgi:protein phosphatase